MLLANNKTIIFDDQFEQIKPLTDVLNKNLIPTLHIDFSLDIEDLPEIKKIKNIRFIFSDFIRGTPSSSDAKTQLTPIINAICSTISINNGPFIIAIWSAHKDIFGRQFKRMLMEVGFKFEIIELDKEKYLLSPNLQELQDDINLQCIGKKNFLKFLTWENKLKDSATNILNLFSNLDEGKKGKMIKKLSIASLGKELYSNCNCEKTQDKGFFNTITNLLYDEIEKNIYAEIHNNAISNEFEQKANIENNEYLNSKLMIDMNVQNSDKNYPGNIYNYDDLLNKCYDLNNDWLNHCGLEKEDILNSLFKKYDNSLIHHFIALEINPYCDHAQQNIKKAKLLLGVIYEENDQLIEKKASPSIYDSIKFNLVLNNEIKTIGFLFSFHHIIRINPDITNQLIPIIRLRKEMVNEIQHQTAFYLSRPGLTTLYT